MRSITFKLTLAFLIVGVIGAVLVAVIFQQRTRNAFTQFILNSEQQTLVNALLSYYQNVGSWQGVDESLTLVLNRTERDFAPGRDPRHETNNFILVGADRQVIYSPQQNLIGQLVPSDQLKSALPLEVNGKIAGWLLLAQSPREYLATSPEGQFLKAVNASALLSAVIAGILALVVGSLLAYSLTRTMRDLKEATIDIARGRLGRQVKVRSKDELGELAASFNQMSLDLDRATQARRQMTADIAHDLRSPLSVIAGYSEALNDGKLAGTPEVYGILYNETLHLNRLVEDLRTLSLADSGELRLQLVRVSPEELLNRAASAYRDQAERKNILIGLEILPDLPEVEVDGDRMAQVLGNLVSNALRHTPVDGKITLGAYQDSNNVFLSVMDTGEGISPADLPNIFDRSYRGDPARQQAGGETGLGLAIARSLIEAQGGQIGVESQPGSGAKFTLSVPIPAGKAGRGG